MKIQTKIASSIKNPEKVAADVKEQIENNLGRFDNQLTRVEVHISEEIVHKSTTNEHRCVLEARLTGLKPMVVKHQAVTIYDCLNGALEKVIKVIDHTRGKLHDQKRNRAEGTSEDIEEIEEGEDEEVLV